MLFFYALITLANLVMYTCINIYIRKRAKSNILKESDDKQMWIWRNIVCSLVHSVISALWSIICFLEEPSLFFDTTKIFQTDEAVWAFYLLPASTGYFIYDSLDIILNDGFRQWEVLSHHLAISITLFMTQIQGIYGYSVCSMIIEVNSINLHIRRLLRMMKIPRPSLSHFNSNILVITTIICRGYFSLHLFFSYLFDNKLNIATSIFGGFSIFVMLGTNSGIIYKLYKSEYLKKPNKNEEKLVM